jgi:peptidoglycan/xylan/chitin deacetylase (PgdA/CDA1 family)
MVLSRVAWVGRLTGPKGEIAYRIITEVAPEFPDIEFTIVGGPVTERFSERLGDNVKLLDFITNVEAVFAESDLVIGAGRVPIEAMRYGLPVIAVGENRYIGPINAATISQAKATNFGDCDQLQLWDAQQLIDDLNAVASGQVEIPLHEYATYVEDYRLDNVYPEVMAVYKQAVIDAYLRGFKEIPVLTYHRVLQQSPESSKFNIFVTVEELESQILNLKKRGFEFITFKDITRSVKVKKPVILTFDDGYEDNYQNLLPLLQKYQARAVIYALADRRVRSNQWDMVLGEPEAPLMTDEQLIACHRSGYVEIGSHGLAHQHLPQLTEAQVREEVVNSKFPLESLINDEVVSFAYPYGDYGSCEVNLVREVGYIFGVGTINGPLSMSADLMRVRRITMFPNTRLAKFWRKTSGFYLRYCRIKGKDF